MTDTSATTAPREAPGEAATGPLPAGHPRIPAARTGVVLLNLGTPDGTGYFPMRRYLSEFLSDRRVIDYSPLFWQPLLQGVILSRRPFKSGHAYATIWNKERDESPLKTVTRSQAERLAARLEARAPGLVVDWAMRYGNPSTDSVLDRLVGEGCRRLVLMALYPQYAAPTTATAYDKAFDALKQMRWQPAVRTMGPYHDHPTYIRLLADSVRSHLAGLDWEPERLVMSYHGVPKRFLIEGDPYHCHCQKTTRLVREALGWAPERVMTVFQSRFGPEEWLQPYLDKTLESLPGEGVRKVAVISPAFATDCLETLEEIAIAGKESFLASGGEAFAYIPCLNDSDGHIDLLEELALTELGGWI
ncbi:ferrochelatase [Marinimicrococcus flavescens]|uniref:Ferrochelatase n=1 Tax=Marinimicrococcus flavescens TaxID=3031815 RepID=A0AAP4D6I6_9PROT|nr:ferrochelatase [Marinimicrococcus flavescens]